MSYGTILGQTPTIPDSIPIGAIILWSGELTTILENWAICDGNNGTPNLVNRFVVSAGGQYALGAIGGEAKHTLTILEMPSHKHSITGYNFGNGQGRLSSGNATEEFTTQTTSSGGSKPHNNLPPYYALYYIMKIA